MYDINSCFFFLITFHAFHELGLLKIIENVFRLNHVQTKLIRLGRFPLSQNFRFEMPESFLCLKERLGLWWIKMTEKIPVILCPANGNSSSRNGNCVQTERLFSFQTSEGRPFVSENFHLIRAFHLHFNRLNRKFWLNGKRLLYWFELVCHPFPPLIIRRQLHVFQSHSNWLWRYFNQSFSSDNTEKTFCKQIKAVGKRRRARSLE